MEFYLVGGAVRDELLELPVKDRDWVVVGATIADMQSKGFLQPNKNFPVFIHPDTGEEYALARRETKTGKGYKGFTIDAAPDVTLEEDLARRDLTINAIAKSMDGVLHDPFNGQKDLEQGWLRATGERFIEDPFRLLRICRFASRFGHLGFRPTHGTWKLMQIAATEELNSLPIERQWLEMEKALGHQQPWRYVLLLKRCGGLAIMQPSLDDALTLENSHSGKSEPEWVKRMQRAVKADLAKEERLAAMLIDLDSAQDIVKQLGAGKKYSDILSLSKIAVNAIEVLLKGGGESFYSVLENLGFHKNEVLFSRILQLVYVLYPEQAVGITTRVKMMQTIMQEITAAPLLKAGVSNNKIGVELKQQRIAAFDKNTVSHV